jgi:hypothetical protein
MSENQPTPKSYNFFFLWVFVSLIYVATGIYIQFYSIDKDVSQAIFNYSMAVTWLCIGWSFGYTPPPAKK